MLNKLLNIFFLNILIKDVLNMSQTLVLNLTRVLAAVARKDKDEDITRLRASHQPST